MNWKKVRQGLGWSRGAWHHPLRKFIKDNKNIKFNSALEVGAGECGTMAPFLLELSNEVTIGCYECNLEKLEKTLSGFGNNMNAVQIDMTKINGKYDLIIAKSVLGGIFRKGESTIDDMNSLMDSIVENNINPGGMLLVLNNGESFFENIAEKFGSRNNNWRFFHPEDFVNASCTYTFGFLSFFSFESRLGVIGKVADYTIYFIDLFISRVVHYPTVILTIYIKSK